MTDLKTFRIAVRDALRFAGRTQQQLAKAIGLHPHVLSRKLNTRSGSVLTSREAVAITSILVEWGGIAARAQAEAMLRAAGVSEQVISAQSWDAPPLRGLTGAGSPPTSFGLSPTSSEESTFADHEEAERVRPPAPPTPLTPLIGRAAEVATVAAALENARLVTITGAGGTGKTRVALQVASVLAARYRDGVGFVDLAPLTDPALIDVAMLRALGLSPQPSETAEIQLAATLHRVQLLLVVDNMEHLVAGSELLGRLLSASPGVRLLVTSRIRLRLYNEYEIRLPPLALPPDRPQLSGLRDSEAVQLFVERSRSARPGFDPDLAELATIGTLCAAVDGIPLAIELLAARTRMWPPRLLLDRITELLPSVGDGARDRPARQQTLEAALAWSDALLTPDDRAVFVRLPVFSGSFDPPAAAAVTGDPEDVIISRLDRLEEQSLLELHHPTVGDQPRFRMLEPIRQYALSRLAEAGQLEQTRKAHLAYFRAFATSIGPPNVQADGDLELDRLYADRTNLIAALAWACEECERDQSCLTDGLRLFVAAGRLWGRRALIAVGLRYARRLLQTDARTRVVEPELRLAALNRTGFLLCESDELEAAKEVAEEARELATELGDEAAQGRAHRVLGEVALASDDLSTADQHLRQELALARRAGNPSLVGEALNSLGQTSRRRRRWASAKAELEGSVAAHAEAGDIDAVASTLGSLGDLAFDRADLATAARHQTESLRLHARYANQRGVAYALEGCARVAAAEGRAADALRYVGTAQRLREASGCVLPGPDRIVLEQVLAGPVAGLSDPERRRAVAAGRRDDPDQVIADALRETTPPPDGPPEARTVVNLHRRTSSARRLSPRRPAGP